MPSAISELLTELGHPLEPALALAQIARIQALAPNHAVFVAVKDGAVVGLVTAFSTPVLHRALPVGRVSVLVVTRAPRRTGNRLRLSSATPSNSSSSSAAAASK